MKKVISKKLYNENTSHLKNDTQDRVYNCYNLAISKLSQVSCPIHIASTLTQC